jgi:branched-chain amino acid transport system ATP-binding protein
VTLEARDLTVRFGGVAALAGVSFAVAPGTVTSLIGPNGAGKTTAFNVITGFQRPTQGTVHHEGQPITGWRPHRIAARGLVRTFQKTSLFPGLTVRENVLTGLPARAGMHGGPAARGRVRRGRRLGAEADRVMDSVGLGGRCGGGRAPTAAAPAGLAVGWLRGLACCSSTSRLRA